MWRHGGLVLGIALFLALSLPIVRYLDHNDVAHQAIQVWLRLYADAIYEYRSTTGQCPSQPDDLAKTSLPKRFPYWKQVVDDGTIVIVWHKRLKPDPKDNAGLILAYHNKGLYAELGRVWVCWGDLRTEHIKREDRQARLQRQAD
jgi:hypothetical protein